jgi:hypothetical protein
MDGQRFDDLARLFAQSTSRRTIWRSALGLAAGWFATRPSGVRAQDGCAPAFMACDEATPCCDAPDFACCGGTCTSIQSDPTNCGSCGNPCGQDSVCCGGTCTPPLDPINCGGCGVACGPCHVCTEVDGTGACVSTCTATQACVDGVCVECPAGTSLCTYYYGNTACVDLLTDKDNCGECGYVCGEDNLEPDGSICVNGQCWCPSGLVVCQDPYRDDSDYSWCADPLTDSYCCGQQGYCDDFLSGSICVGGECVCPEGTQPSGFACCPDGTRSCGHMCCPSDSRCEDYYCVPCPAGQTGCDDRCVDVATDPANCGACSMACDRGASCIHGACHAVGGEGQTPSPPTPTPPTPRPTAGEPVPAPTSSAGAASLPSTGTGSGGQPSGHGSVPLVGPAAALGAAAAAWLRHRVRVSANTNDD